ncbi:RNA pseudouridine synthase [Gluconobacter oxydans]|uniref:RluA family pseudouridine synthase n=1 Tax=Gluconobacter thailandicus TaxID=257438 RepID=UPI0002999EB9|nr:RNA pseudouridine synthase [Gluconobacter thailandicus]AFW00964.1 ribosomal large subunit pseudouridine synthase A [Gluconobacter oxydans H24]ANQ40379.1 RNA pseudouridine synthase [Gluconobacter oxydans]
MKNDRRRQRSARPERPPSPAPRGLFYLGQDLPVLLETPRFLVLNKPAGLAAHPGPSTQDSVETRLVSHPRGGPWLAHRLDADTSGCLLIARRKTALLEAQAAFQNRQVRKLYWTIVEGTPAENEGEISAPLLRQSNPSGWRMIVDPKGDAAVTRWRVLGRANGRSWLELELLTGRTHQARIHCASLGTPIVGDRVYGKSDANGLHLLARSLHVSLPEGDLEAIAPPSPAMAEALERLGWKDQS